jgi:prepilin-type N-terminal cleavage/methylation domain-containing protein
MQTIQTMNHFKEKLIMKTTQNRGFTLIELLTVIAIIAVLSGITLATLPGVLERARITKLRGILAQIHTSMVGYMGEHATYPPAYGFIEFKVKQEYQSSGFLPAEHNTRYFLKPYLHYLGRYGVEDLHDNFSTSFDTNEDGVIGLLEYSPIAQTSASSDYVEFPVDLYDGSRPDDMLKQEDIDSRPMVYAPVNLRQYKRAKKYWINSGDYLARTWDRTHNDLRDVRFPPAEYDAYALISGGPRYRTFGIADPEIGTSPTDPLGNELEDSPTTLSEVYHVRALRAYFLAERDLNQNGEQDLHFDSRTKRNEASIGLDGYNVNRRGSTSGPGQTTNALPDRDMPDGVGPWLHVVGE